MNFIFSTLWPVVLCWPFLVSLACFFLATLVWLCLMAYVLSFFANSSKAISSSGSSPSSASLYNDSSSLSSSSSSLSLYCDPSLLSSALPPSSITSSSSAASSSPVSNLPSSLMYFYKVFSPANLDVWVVAEKSASVGLSSWCPNMHCGPGSGKWSKGSILMSKLEFRASWITWFTSAFSYPNIACRSMENYSN